MESLVRYLATPNPCGYLPNETWRLEYEHVLTMTAAEYAARLLQGWRRFGRVLFRPRCPICSSCRSLRVLAKRYQPDRSQRRARTANGDTELRIGTPSVTRAKLALYDRYHAYQTIAKGWPEHPAKDPDEYASSFVDNPFPTQEWCYYRAGKLVGVGYVDDLKVGLSAIYFFYDPEERRRSPGTWNVLRVIEEAARRRLPHVYLGYYVAGSASMTYKSRFKPSQVLGQDGAWHDFVPGDDGEGTCNPRLLDLE
jgi:arginine-tRNA-protein transferase